MKVTYSAKITPDCDPPHFNLTPESDRDQEELERILKEGSEAGVKIGFGRHPDTMKFLHMQVPLLTNKENS